MIGFFLTLSISILGTINKRDGIGRQSIELATQLSRQHDVKMVPIGTYQNLEEEELALIQPDYQKLGDIVLLNTSLPEVPYIVETLKHYRKEGQKFVCYTMVESSRMDPYLVEVLHFFDYVLVPDPFLVEVLKESGFQGKVEVIPLAVDIELFLKQELVKSPKEVFTFANYSAALFRKDQQTIIRAFAKKFKNKPEVKLVLHCRGGDAACISVIEAEIQKENLKNVEFVLENKSIEQYLTQFLKTNCYVSPSLGEGFSIQPREAMALGLPVIISPNTGQKTIADSGLAVVLKKQKPLDAIYNGAFGFFSMGEMFQADVDELADLMEKVYLNYESYLTRANERRAWAMRYACSRSDYVERFSEFFERLKGEKCF